MKDTEKLINNPQTRKNSIFLKVILCKFICTKITDRIEIFFFEAARLDKMKRKRKEKKRTAVTEKELNKCVLFHGDSDIHLTKLKGGNIQF